MNKQQDLTGIDQELQPPLGDGNSGIRSILLGTRNAAVKGES